MSRPALLAALDSDATVSDAMRSGVVTVPQDASLRRCAAAMASHRIHAVLVIGRDGGTPLGWVTDRSLLEYVARETAPVFARDAISQPPVFVSPGASIASAVEGMLDAGVSHLIVAIRPQDPPEGVLTALDVMGLLFRTG